MYALLVISLVLLRAKALHPFFVVVAVSVNESWFEIGGGALLNSEWVLCSQSTFTREEAFEPGGCTALAGTAGNMQKRLVIMWIAHPESAVNLALLKLENPFGINEFVAPVGVLSIDRNTRSDGVWSFLHPAKRIIDKLRAVAIRSDDLAILPQRTCEVKLNQSIARNEFCGFWGRNRSENLQGPLVGKGLLFGVFSRKVQLYLIFTRVDSEMDYLTTMSKQIARSSAASNLKLRAPLLRLLAFFVH